VLHLKALREYFVPADGLEPSNSEEGYFTGSCNCRYAIQACAGAENFEISTYYLTGSYSSSELHPNKIPKMSMNKKALGFIPRLSYLIKLIIYIIKAFYQ
jgi:hypothetical protein